MSAPDHGHLLTQRLRLDPLRQEDAAAVLAYELRNRADFAPHGPLRRDVDFHPEAAFLRAQEQLREVAERRAVRWVLRWRNSRDEVIGHVALTQIQRGVRHSAVLGYGLDAACRGRGLMTEALQAAIDVMFVTHGLHRIEANHRLDNLASARVLQKLGFERDGLARAYIRLNGEWTDVVLNGKLNPAWQPEGE